MPAKKYTHLLMINLHEVQYLNDILKVLSKEYVRETLIIDGEGVHSRHGDSFPEIGMLLKGLMSSLKEKNNQNFLVLALVKKEKIANIRNALKMIIHEERYAASFWVIPVEDYFYHKGGNHSEGKIT